MKTILNQGTMKRNIQIDRTSISSEEILKGKDFDALMEQYKGQSSGGGNTPNTPSKPFYKSGWFSGGIAIAVAAVITVAVISSKSTNNDNQNNVPVVSNTTTDEEQIEKAFVSPPLPGVDVPKDRYVVNADKGGKVKHKTGTEITIPALAFKDEDGNIVKGDVEIEYREFHDQADIFFSGIPMEYDSAGKKSMFESAGMMEINAYQDGKKLSIVPDKNFIVCMHTNNPDPKFNLYYLDEEAKKWDYEGKDSIDLGPQDEVAIVAEDGYNPIQELKDECNTKQDLVQEQEKVVKKAVAEVKKVESTKPVKPRKAEKDKHSFDIDVNKEEFPEIAVYKEMLFEAVDQQNFDTKIYDVAWNDIELQKNGDNFNIKLTKEEQVAEVIVIPVFEGKSYEQAMNMFNKSFNTYSEKLANRRQTEKTEKEELQARKDAYVAAKQKWEEEAKLYRERFASQAIAQQKMKRIFEIRKTGTWNCDSPVPRPMGRRILANCVDKATKKPLYATTMSLVQKDLNAVFPMGTNNEGQHQFNVVYDRSRANVLWGVASDNEVMVAHEDAFDEITGRDSTYTIPFIKVDVKGKSLAEIKKIIGC